MLITGFTFLFFFVSILDTVYSITPKKGKPGSQKSHGMPGQISANMVTVELNVYSGEPNPTMRMNFDYVSNMATNNGLHCPDPFVGVLGYRGFTVHGFKSTVMIISRGSHLLGELQLIQSFKLPADVSRHIVEEIADGPRTRYPFILAESYTQFGCERRTSTTNYEPYEWNSDRQIQRRNNCYNYANNVITNTFAQPGKANGYKRKVIDGPSIQNGSVLDGLRPLPSLGRCFPLSSGNLVALVIWPCRDYHFYRLDSNGLFSHKPGRTRARNTDNSGNLITDPRTCDRGPYTIFHTFLETSPDNINIK